MKRKNGAFVLQLTKNKIKFAQRIKIKLKRKNISFKNYFYEK